jgi:DNA-binding response OmpR family regulator
MREANITSKMILVVDDDPDIRQGLTDLLESQGYTVHSVGTGWAALARVKTLTCAAVILDVQLPDQDGTEVLHLLKQYDHNLPIIVLTAADKQDARVVLLRHEAFALLQKPYARLELVAVLSRATSMS